MTPAVTCTVQSTFLTGLLPRGHGIVANGWYFRDLAEVWLWRQSNRLVAGEKIWEAGKKRDPAFTCANMFWWYNMYSSADWARRRGRCTRPTAASSPTTTRSRRKLRDELDANARALPAVQVLGAGDRHRSTRWIADATLHVMADAQPTLTLFYLPHLDYDLQRFGPDVAHPRVQQDPCRDRRRCRRLLVD